MREVEFKRNREAYLAVCMALGSVGLLLSAKGSGHTWGNKVTARTRGIHVPASNCGQLRDFPSHVCVSPTCKGFLSHEPAGYPL